MVLLKQAEACQGRLDKVVIDNGADECHAYQKCVPMHKVPQLV